MKCDNWIDPLAVGKKGQLLNSAFIGSFEANRKTIRDVCANAEPCRGDIVAEVRVENEPYMGGTSGSLRVTYTCRRCRQELYGRNLPREEEEIAAILTEHIRNQGQRGT